MYIHVHVNHTIIKNGDGGRGHLHGTIRIGRVDVILHMYMH